MLKPITPYCECGKPATRFAVDRWPYRDGRYRTLALCPHCPTPDEIDQRAAAVREQWSDTQFYQRHFQCNANGVAYRLAYEFPQCQPTNLTGRVDRREMESD